MSPTTDPPTKFQSILNAAFDNYAKQTGLDLTRHPSAAKLQDCHSPDDVVRLLLERETEFKDYRDKYRKLIDCFRPIVQVVHAFSGVLGEVVPFKPMKAIFVAVDVLLSAASSVSTSYDVLVELFQTVANFIKRLHIYTEKIPFSSMMSDIALKIMVEVLSVLALATKQINQGRLKKFAKKLLGESDVEAILQSLDRLTQEEARVTAAHTLEVVHELFDNMKIAMDYGKASTDGIRQALDKISNEVHKLKRDQLQEKIRYWLCPPDPSTNHNIARRYHYDGTASWFTRSGTFENWKATGSLLWIHGKPGAGKSILCSSIIQHVEGLRDMGSALIGYFYCDFRDPKKQDVGELLASLVAQLSARSDVCYNILSALYSEYDAGSRRPGDDALMDCLENMLKIGGAPTIYIIIDALDECPGDCGVVSPRDQVLELVERLIDLHLPNVRICATSRPEADIHSALTSLASHIVSLHDEDGQRKDIADYVRSVVYSDRKMRRWRMEDKEMVVSTLSRKADGMFRWVVCQLEALKRCFPSTIRPALDDLPESLDETYDRILLGITRERKGYAQRLFQCLAVSIRPLRVEELAGILAIQFDTGSLPNYNVKWCPDNSEEDVLSVCSSLITIVDVDGSRVVQFSHFSVQEYLSSKRLADAGHLLSHYHILPHSAHAILAQASLSVLLALDDRVDKDIMKTFPLATYAARNWVDHAQFENVSSSIKDAMARLFDAAKPHFATWVWIYDVDNPFREMMFATRPTPPEAVPLYYATLCGFRDLIEHLIITNPLDVNARGGYHRTALHVAIAKRDVDVMKLLLAHGADVTALGNRKSTPLHKASLGERLEMMKLLLGFDVDVDAQDDDGNTPLYLASSEGESEVAQVLLQHGASVDSHTVDGWTPLLIAAQDGHLDMVYLLFGSGAAVNLQSKDGWTPLHLASQNGHLDVARLLLQSGAAVDFRHKVGWTPLHQASQTGHRDVVQLLLQNGAIVDSQSKDGSTPLHLASQNGHLDVTRLLLQSGAAVDFRHEDGWTPLHQASQTGHLDVVQLLLQNGAVVDSQSEDGWTPLHLASQNGHLDVARLLLQSGAAVDFRHEDGWTPLHQASLTGHLDVVQLLLQNGAVVDSQSKDGSTPLHLASENGHLNVARLLLQSGAAVDFRHEDGRTPLHQASQTGHLDVVQLLLQNGAVVDSHHNAGWTPLFFASENGHLDVVRLLFQSGATVDPHRNENQTPSSDLNFNFTTPLHLTSVRGHLNVAQLLILCGADADTRNQEGKTSLDLALDNQKLDVAKFLVGHMGSMDSLPRIDLTALDTVSHGPPPLVAQPSLGHTSVGNKRETSLHAASKWGDLDIVRSLIGDGADVNERDTNHETSLHFAAREGKVEVAKLLIKYDANVNSQDRFGWAPLHTASRRGHFDIVHLLLKHSADMNAESRSHDTALHLALNSRHWEIVKLLLEQGANVHVRNDLGLTPPQVASRKGEREIMRLLSEYAAHGK